MSSMVMVRWMLVLVVASGCAVTDSREIEMRTLVERHVEPFVEGRYAPAIVVGIARSGDRSFHGFGEVGEGASIRPDRKTLFETGSIGKVFTALLLADAIERGELDGDRAVDTRSWLGVDLPMRDAQPIRTWHLASHLSGLPAAPDDLDYANPNPYEAYTEERLAAYLERADLLSTPGEAYAYSNIGAGLLGLLLGHETGLSYATLVEQRIARPLGLADTSVHVAPEDVARVAPPHAFGMPTVAWGADDALAAAGCLRSSADDTLRFAQACLDPPTGRLGDAMRRTLERRFELGEGAAIGLGWHILADGTRWHNGSTGGYHAFLAIRPEHELALVVLANDVCPQVTELGFRLLESLGGGTPEPLDVRIPMSLDETTLARLEGRYVDGSGFGVDVRRRAGQLAIRLDGQAEYLIFAESPTRFVYRVVEAAVEFTIVEDQAVSMTLVQDGSRLEFARET